jgi:hypothetical protein
VLFWIGSPAGQPAPTLLETLFPRQFAHTDADFLLVCRGGEVKVEAGRSN